MKRTLLIINFLVFLFLSESAQSQSWLQVPSGTNGQLNSIFSVNSNLIYCIGNAGVGLKTINAGLNWTNMNIGLGEKFSVRFLDADNGFVACANTGILKTSDGGINWGYISGGSVNLFDLYFTDTVSGWAVGGLEMGFGALFNPFPQHYIQINAIGGKELRGIWFTDHDHGWVVGNLGVIIRTINYGTTWLQQTSNTTEVLNKVMFINSNTGITVGRNGTILKTTDAGLNWIAQNSGTLEDLNSVYFADVFNVWACGSNGTIIHSIDGGINWTAENSGTTEILTTIQGVSSTDVWACGYGGVILHRSGISAVSEAGEKKNFSLFPNPTSEIANLDFENPNSEKLTFTLYNTMGQVVRRINFITKDRVLIERNGLSNGIYFFKLNSSRGIVSSGKILFE